MGHREVPMCPVSNTGVTEDKIDPSSILGWSDGKAQGPGAGTGTIFSGAAWGRKILILSEPAPSAGPVRASLGEIFATLLQTDGFCPLSGFPV